MISPRSIGFPRCVFISALVLGTGACATSTPATETAAASDEAKPPPRPPKLKGEARQAARKNAQVVAGTWLLEVDKGNYAGSWDQAASPLQNRVGRGEWTQGLTGARKGFGALTRRHFVKTMYTNKLQPAGHYVVVNYHSQFEHSPAKESVTVYQDADNEWRVLMYGIEKTDAPPPEEAPAEDQGDADDQADADAPEGAETP